MTKAELAISYFEGGYNCCQAVALAFQEELGVDRELLAKLSSSFGGGFGRLREVCGAFSGICLVAGVLLSKGEATGEHKAEHYALIRELAEEFKKANGGSIVCRELLGETEKLSSANPAERTAEYKHKRPCYLIVANSAEIIENKLKEKGII